SRESYCCSRDMDERAYVNSQHGDQTNGTAVTNTSSNHVQDSWTRNHQKHEGCANKEHKRGMTGDHALHRFKTNSTSKDRHLEQGSSAMKAPSQGSGQAEGGR